MIIVIAVIWILMMATTIYLGWSDEKRKTIEAQWCANTIWWEINNFIFYTLTSKHLKIDDNSISPTFYIVQLTWWTNDEWKNCSITNSWVYCREILLSYNTWTEDETIWSYKTLSVANTCQQTRQPLVFYWSWANDTNIKYVKMNKWLTPRNLHDNNVFYIQLSWNSNNKILLWDIITALCLNDDCTNPKEIWKFGIDSRSQTISRRNCKFYDDNPSKCKERES